MAATSHKTSLSSGESLGSVQRENAELPLISSFLIKVTARCNLNCDYCYVFNHADQSWKKMPSLLSSENRQLLAKRISEYAKEVNLKECLIVFHGGEPLLVGVERIIEIADLIKKEMPIQTKLYFSMQTNGALLTKQKLEILEENNIGVSLSLDGPKIANDLHRLDRKGNSSYDKVIKAYELLKQHPKSFSGVIGVIDPRVPPKEILSFFAELDPPTVDFLLPDANYISTPVLRDREPDIYKKWLIEAFDQWYDNYPELRVRIFEGILGSIAGLPSPTDALGLGDISLLSIETDGTYHDLDVLKITEEGYSSLGTNLKDNSILETLASPKIAIHRKLLSYNGLSKTCQLCPEVKICGGGSVPHRYSQEGFNNPTIYCAEMLALISHIRKRLVESVTVNNNKNLKIEPEPGYEEFDVLSYEKCHIENKELDKVFIDWVDRCSNKFLNILPYVGSLDPSLNLTIAKIKRLPNETIGNIAKRPSTIFWVKALEEHKKGLKLYDIEGKVIHIDPQYLETLYRNRNFMGIELHSSDIWLRLPFGKGILFEDKTRSEKGIELVKETMELIKQLNPALEQEIRRVSPHFQFIHDPSADPEKIVSYSDNLVPGALYLSIYKGNTLLDPYDLADSIIHEHRHQKLYLLEQFLPVIVSDTPLVPSPWRKEPRPVSGLFHGTFVFKELRNYWVKVCQRKQGIISKKIKDRTAFAISSLNEALHTLRGCHLTAAGQSLLEEFNKQNAHYINEGKQ